MPETGPGKRFSTLATKATAHGKPVIEKNHPGIAFKSTQTPPAYPSAANALLVPNIAIGEEFVIDMTGLHEVDHALLPGGAVVGDALWIVIADNTLALAAAAGRVPFGRVSEINATSGRDQVNLNLRGTF